MSIEKGQPCTIFWSASTARVSERTNTGFLVITLETGVSSRLSSRAITLAAMSFSHEETETINKRHIIVVIIQ